MQVGLGASFFFCLAREAVLATARGEGQTGRTRFVRSLCLLDYMLIELGQCLFVFLSFFGRCGQRALVRTGRTRKDKTTTITTKIGKNALINSVDLVVHGPCSCHFVVILHSLVGLMVFGVLQMWPMQMKVSVEIFHGDQKTDIAADIMIETVELPSKCSHLWLTTEGLAPLPLSSSIARCIQGVFMSTKERQGQKVFSWFVCAFFSLFASRCAHDALKAALTVICVSSIFLCLLSLSHSPFFDFLWQFVTMSWTLGPWVAMSWMSNWVNYFKK